MPDSALLVPQMKAIMFFLTCMVFLHYYWYILLSQMLIGYITKGAKEDLLQKTPTTA
jgi:hypothetical protein